MSEQATLLAQLKQSGYDNSALLVIDIRDFRSINKTYGYACGDAVLAIMRQRLQHFCNAQQQLFYLGDDEFALLIQQVSSPAIAPIIAQRITEHLQQPFDWQATELLVQVNVGIALMSLSGDGYTLLLDAERACYKARKLRESFYLYEHSPNRTDGGTLALRRDLQQALKHNALELYYQPKQTLKGQPGYFCEALIRWPHPERGLIPPSVFLPLCEKLGLNLSLARWVLNTALRQLSQLPDSQHHHVAINLSADLVDEPELPHIVSNALSIWGVQPQQLTLEITESAVIEDKESGFNTLQSLQQLGVVISIDDFGTGYSSLAYFKEIPANELKIDRSFIEHIQHDERDLKLAKLVVDLAHSFALPVVAEGIEDAASLALVKQLGCDYAQGFFIAKPMPQPAYLQWLQANSQHAAV